MNLTKFYGLGRRKSSLAKVYLFPGTGKLTIVKKEFGKPELRRSAEEYFPNKLLIKDLSQALSLLNFANQYDVEAQVSGGGFSGQAGAIRLGITRALIEFNPELKPTLKAAKLTRRDPRMKERKKFGKYGARRSPQFTKR